MCAKCTHTYAYVHTCVHRPCVHMFACVQSHTCTNVHTCKRVCMLVYTQVTNTYMHAQMRVYLCACLCVYIHAYICAHMRPYMCTYIHACMARSNRNQNSGIVCGLGRTFFLLSASMCFSFQALAENVLASYLLLLRLFPTSEL